MQQTCFKIFSILFDLQIRFDRQIKFKKEAFLNKFGALNLYASYISSFSEFFIHVVALPVIVTYVIA